MIAQDLLDIIVAADRRFTDQVTEMLALGRHRLGFELGILSRVEGTRYEVMACVNAPGLDVQPGMAFDLEGTFCARTVASEGAIGFARAEGTAWERHPALEAFGLRSYLGAPVRVGGRVFGTVNFSSRAERAEPLGADEQHFAETIARWVGIELERREGARREGELREMLQGVLESSLDGVMTFRSVRDEGGEIVDFEWLDVNPAGARMVHRAAEGLVGRRMLDVLPGNLEDGLFDRYRRVVETGEPELFEHRYSHDGLDASFRVSARRLGDGFVVGFADITELVSAIDEAERARDTSALLLDSVPAMIWFKDTDSRVLRVNASVARAMGMAKSELEGRTTEELHPEEAAAYVAADREVMRSGQPRCGIIERVRVGPGEPVWASTDKVPIIGEDGEATGLLVISSDITRLKRTEETLRRMAEEDALTGCANRASFQRALASLDGGGSSGGVFGVMLMDFDGFKAVNDSLGHDAGDELLRRVAGRMRGVLKSSDVLARLGGDEFGVIVTGLDGASGASAIAERIRSVCAEPHHIGGHTVRSTASIGVATSERAYDGWEAMVAAADRASYEAKARGGDAVVCVDERTLARDQRRAWIETELRGILEAGGLGAVFQPIVGVECGEVLGVELLSRWPGGGVRAREFVDAAERSSLIHELTESVARRGAAFASERCLGGGFVSVNLCKREALSAETPRMIAAAAAACGVPASRLMVEVSESVASDGRSGVERAIEGFKSLGVRVALSDFGYGSAPLRLIRDLPFDVLKLDSRFLRDATRDRRLLSVVRAVSDLASNLGIRVCAQELDTRRKLELAMSLDLWAVQGTIICEAMEADAMVRRLGSGVVRLSVRGRAA